MREIDLLLLNECCENKGSRENVIKAAFKSYNEHCETIIELYKLKRVRDKYILQYRDFSENSYSKKKIREEEIIFIRKIYIYLRVANIIQDNMQINLEANLITNKIYQDDKFKEIDKEIYLGLFEKYIN